MPRSSCLASGSPPRLACVAGRASICSQRSGGCPRTGSQVVPSLRQKRAPSAEERSLLHWPSLRVLNDSERACSELWKKQGRTRWRPRAGRSEGRVRARRQHCTWKVVCRGEGRSWEHGARRYFSGAPMRNCTRPCPVSPSPSDWDGSGQMLWLLASVFATCCCLHQEARRPWPTLPKHGLGLPSLSPL